MQEKIELSPLLNSERVLAHTPPSFMSCTSLPELSDHNLDRLEQMCCHLIRGFLRHFISILVMHQLTH